MPLCGGQKTLQRKLVLLYVPSLTLIEANGPSLTSLSMNSGDGACGKTSLLNVFTRGYIPHA